MGVIFQTGYSLPSGDEPLTNARIAHANNWLAGGTVTASSTESEFFSSGPNNTLTYERWKPTAVSATWEYDHGSAAECDYCVIGAHTMGTNGNTLQVQYWNGSSWTGVIAATAIADDGEIYVMFEPQTRQRWRISISVGTAPEIGVIKFGKAMQLERPISGAHAPLSFARNTTMRANSSVTGETLGQTKLRTNLRTSFQWNNISRTWIDANWPEFQRAAESEPFFIAWRPGVYSDAALCQADDVPATSFTGSRDFMTASVNVTAYSHD